MSPGPTNWDLATFDISAMLRCARGVRSAMTGRPSVEGAAQAAVRYFHDAFRGADGERQCVLARFYKTHAYAPLPAALQEIARAQLGGGAPPPANLTCLTLLASTGDQPAWRERRRSRGHQAIALASHEMVERAPMIAALFRQLGVDSRDVVQGALTADPRGARSFDVFHVAEALGSPHIPAQADFVVPYGVRSVVGFGGALRTGELFAVILFARAPISESTAGRFRNIALDVKYALFALGSAPVFEDGGGDA